MTQSTTNNDAALNAFADNMAEITVLLARLQSAADDHLGVAPEDVRWGHVADTGLIASQLREISDRVFNEGEYAA